MVYQPQVTHPSTNRGRRALTSVNVRATVICRGGGVAIYVNSKMYWIISAELDW